MLRLAAASGVAGFVDVETTGLSRYKDEVLELSLFLFAYHRQTGEITEILEEYTGLREASCPIHPGAARVHGITQQDVRGMRLDEERVERLIARAEFLVAHNASFDWGFVTPLFPSAAAKPWFCSMRGVDWKGEGFSSRSLQHLLTAHHIDAGQAHRAGSDVQSALALLGQRGRDGETYFLKMLRNGPYRGAGTPAEKLTVND